MIVYVAEKAAFRDDAISGRIEDKIQSRMGRRVADSEVRAWQQSLTYMNVVLEDDGIPDNAGICIELGIPQTSKRIDFIVSGYDSGGGSNAAMLAATAIGSRTSITKRAGRRGCVIPCSTAQSPVIRFRRSPFAAMGGSGRRHDIRGSWSRWHFTTRAPAASRSAR